MLKLERIRRGLWTYKQPLTHLPRVPEATVSDLFVWRNSQEWKTYFELMDISGMFTDDAAKSDRTVTLMFYDEQGKFLTDSQVALFSNRRITLDLSEFVSNTTSSLGTFCVFHAHTPPEIAHLGSFIAERGYVSYAYRGAPLRSYVHGNLDAVALLTNREIQLLGASSVLTREYRLQCDLAGPTQYEVLFVNSSSSSQRLFCDLVATLDNKSLRSKTLTIQPAGCQALTIGLSDAESARLLIRSKLVMARPLVFGFRDQDFNVFHG